MNETNEPMSLRDTARGVAVRAGILGLGGAVLFAWVFSLAAKTASGLVKVFTGLLLLSVGGGVLAWKARKFQ